MFAKTYRVAAMFKDCGCYIGEIGQLSSDESLGNREAADYLLQIIQDSVVSACMKTIEKCVDMFR